MEEESFLDIERVEFPSYLDRKQMHFFENTFYAPHILLHNKTPWQTNRIAAEVVDKQNRFEAKSYFKRHFDFILTEKQNKTIFQFKNIEIREADIERLAPGSFLNDTIIDFYLKVLRYCEFGAEKENQIHIFNTFFFLKLMNLVNLEQSKLKARLGTELLSRNQVKLTIKTIHGKLKKWHKHIDLFHKNYIIIPINDNLHWSLVIIANLPNFKRIVLKKISHESLSAEAKPMLVSMDSLTPIDDYYLQLIRSYFHFELLSGLQVETGVGPIQVDETTLPGYQILLGPSTEEYE